MNLNKQEHIEPKLYAGQRIYKVVRGDVIEWLYKTRSGFQMNAVAMYIECNLKWEPIL